MDRPGEHRGRALRAHSVGLHPPRRERADGAHRGGATGEGKKDMSPEEFKKALDDFQRFLDVAKANPDVCLFAGTKQLNLNKGLGVLSEEMNNWKKEVQDLMKNMQPPEGFVPPD